jgi:O-acetyl-ADP-ribose deacetylase (regulator of RNase III)
MRIEKGDILKVKSGYIAQQCNCTSIRGRGLSQAIAEKYPEFSPYKKRRPMDLVGKYSNIAILEDRPYPGTVEIIGDENISIINIYGQYYPGKPTQSGDDELTRQRWFVEALNSLVEHFKDSSRKETIHFPYKIGCGLAGGDWQFYFETICEFSTKLPNTEVIIWDNN